MNRLRISIACLVVVSFLSGCNPTPPPASIQGGPRAWIDAPLDGSRLPLAPVEIVSHTNDPQSIVQVELNVNGDVVRSDPNPDTSRALVAMRQIWSPTAPGNYTILVRAQSTGGVWGEYARAVVTIGEASTGIVQGAVYSDLNGNGLPNDPGDAPMDGVLVTLSGCASKTTTTAGGSFKFTDLPAGTCLVKVSKTGWKFSGTFPTGIGYPAKAVSDPTKPTAFSLFMSPIATPTPTPTAKPGAPTMLPPVSIAFFADQPTLIAGQCTTIHWQVTNASQVFLDNAAVSLSGSKRDCPTKTIAHALRVVTLDNQTAQRALTITVVPPSVTPTRTRTPTVPPPPAGCVGAPNISTFSASPASIIAGQSTTLSWGAVTNADSVEIDHGIGGVGTPGSTTVSPGSTTIYTLTARCGSNAATRQTTVTVTTRRIIIVPPLTSITPTPTQPIIK